MTKQLDILNDENYIPVLDNGFVGFVDSMGDDQSIVQAARVSYGAGTKSYRADRGLIRYLMRHEHWTPFEMCQVKLHLRVPIFVMRQWVRHRTASLNEESARYSIVVDEFYSPELDVIQPQSADNKQGRAGSLKHAQADAVRSLIDDTNRASYAAYMRLLANGEFGDGYPGIARELARTVLPVGTYTEFYWSQNLRNIFHLIRLRTDPHAQYEIRAYANAVYDLIEPHFPLACEAFEDYIRQGASLSRMEVDLLKQLIDHQKWNALSADTKVLSGTTGLSSREIDDFKHRFGLR